MYSSPKIAVDKGLGFDFSGIADLVKAALPTGLNIFQNQMQLKQIKSMQQAGYVGGYAMQSPNVYGDPYGILPLSQSVPGQPTFGPYGQPYRPSSGMGTGTMLAIGAAAVVGILAYKILR